MVRAIRPLLPLDVDRFSFKVLKRGRPLADLQVWVGIVVFVVHHIYGGMGSASCQGADGREEPEVVTSRDGHLFAGNSNYL